MKKIFRFIRHLELKKLNRIIHFLTEVLFTLDS
jgi:hypothetical protein